MIQDAVFRVATTNLHIRGDGLLLAPTNAGQEVRELTDADASELGPAYVGNALMMLSDSSDDFSKTAEVLGQAVDVVEFANLAKDFFELGEKLNNWITGATPHSDPISRALGEINTALNRIEDLTLASWASQRSDNLQFLGAHSSTALHTAARFLADGRPFDDPTWAARIALAERDSLIAVHTLTGSLGSGLWVRPSSLKALSWAGDPNDYYRGWMPHIPDRAEVDPLGLVWDHRWALPAAVYAIAVRVMVLKAFGSGGLCEEVLRYVSFLGDVYRKMQDGVRQARVTDQMRHEYGTMGRMPAAAVDIYGGYFVARVIYYGGGFQEHTLALPAGAYPPSGLNLHAYSVDDVSRNIEFLNNYWWGHVSLTIGLPNLFTFVSELHAMCQPASKPSDGIRKWHRKVIATQTDVKARRAAAAARTLLTLNTEKDGTLDPTHAFAVYEALRGGGERAQSITTEYIEKLTQLGMSVADGLSR